MCDGAAVAESSALGVFLLANGQSSNGDGTVDVYDMRGLFPLGVSASHGLLSTGGAETHTLGEGEIPAHVHQERAGWAGGGSVWGVVSQPNVAGDQVVNHYTESVGGGGAHNNLPPYLCLNFIIYGGRFMRILVEVVASSENVKKLHDGFKVLTPSGAKASDLIYFRDTVEGVLQGCFGVDTVVGVKDLTDSP
jgi:microcystin-dependent protein